MHTCRITKQPLVITTGAYPGFFKGGGGGGSHCVKHYRHGIFATEYYTVGCFLKKGLQVVKTIFSIFPRLTSAAFFRYWYQLYVSPHLRSVARPSALGIGSCFPALEDRLCICPRSALVHVFPCLASVTGFPSLGIGCFLRIAPVFPHFISVACSSVL